MHARILSNTMQASIPFSASCFWDLEKSIPLLPRVYFPQMFSSTVPGFAYSFLAILFHSFILSYENVKKAVPSFFHLYSLYQVHIQTQFFHTLSKTFLAWKFCVPSSLVTCRGWIFPFLGAVNQIFFSLWHALSTCLMSTMFPCTVC